MKVVSIVKLNDFNKYLSDILLRIWSHLLKKSLMENFIFCEVLSFKKLSGSSIFISLYLVVSSYTNEKLYLELLK